MAQKTYRVVGQVIDRETRKGVSDLRVEAWDKDLLIDDFLGEATTDESGQFTIVFDPSRFQGIFLDSDPDIYFKVYAEGKLISSTEDSVLWNVKKSDIEITIEVGEAIEDDPNEPWRRVYGLVQNRYGETLDGVTMQAFDCDMRSRKELGSAMTEDGKYEIRYKSSQLSKPKKAQADLLLKVLDADGEDLHETAVQYSAPDELEVNIDLLVGKAEYTHYLNIIATHLGDTPLAELADDDVAYLSAKTGIERDMISQFVAAAGMAVDTGLDSELFYGLLRQGLPDKLPNLLSQSREVLLQALKSSLDGNIVPADLNIEAAWENLLKLQVDNVLNPKEAVGIPLGGLIETAGLTPEQQQKLASAWVGLDKSDPEFMDKLLSAAELDAAKADELKFTFEVGGLTRHHLPLVQFVHANSHEKNPDALRGLTVPDKEAWERVLFKGIGVPADIEGETDDERVANYAQEIANNVERKFPTAFVAARLAERMGKDEPLSKMGGVVSFLSANLDFELGTESFASYLHRTPEALKRSEMQDDDIPRLKAVQRVFNLGPAVERFETMRVLLNANLDSAVKVSRLGRPAFIRNYEGVLGLKNAIAVFERAAQRAAIAMTTLMRYGMRFNASLPRVLQWDDDVVEEAKQQIPDWESLFGNIDFCACEHCRSVYSPAAYLADILRFLQGIPSEDNQDSALEVLSGTEARPRRGDIRHIELSCHNTNTLMPYIDLVLEILEQAIPPDQDIQYHGSITAGNVPADLLNLLQNQDMPFTDKAIVYERDSDGHFILRDEKVVCKLIDQGGDDWIVKQMRQTYGTSEELALLSEYIRPAAYDTLAAAIYPWDQPFDLWLAQTRIYLEKLGTSRLELLEAFVSPDERLTDPAIAAEALGVSRWKWEIISGTELDPSDPWEYWGLPENDPEKGHWLTRLQTVSTLLEQSKLSYDELVELLDTGFINKDGLLTIAFNPNHPCSLDHAHIRRLTAGHADRIHRFIRLRRALGWSSWELDQFISVLGEDSLDANLLIKLSHVQRIHREKNIPLDELLCWWGSIPTTALNGGHSLYTRLFQNRAVANPVDPAFKLNSEGAELANPEPPDDGDGGQGSPQTVGAMKASGQPGIDQHAMAIQGALGISAADFSLLISEVLPDNNFDLANLSCLYRVVSLARAVGLPIGDTLTLLALSDADLFGGTEDAIRFLEEADKVKASSFSVAELDYLFRHVEGEVAPSEEMIIAFLSNLRDDLQQAHTDTELGLQPAKPIADRTRTSLSLILPEDVLEEAIALIDGASAGSPADPEEFIDEHFSIFMNDVVEAKTKLVGAGQLTDPNERFAYVLTTLLNYMHPIHDVTADRTYASLSLILSEDTLEEAMALISGASTGGPADPEEFIDEHFSIFMNDVVEAKTKLVGVGQLTDPNERYAYILLPLLGYLRPVHASATERAQAFLSLLPDLDEVQLGEGKALIDGTLVSESSKQKDYIAEHFSVFLNDVNKAAEVLVDGGLTDPNERFAYILLPLIRYFRPKLLHRKVIDHVVREFGLEADAAKKLLYRLTLLGSEDSDQETGTTEKPPAKSLFDVLKDSTFYTSSEDVSDPDFVDQRKSYILLDKASRIVKGIGIPASDLDWLFEHGSIAPRFWLNLNELYNAGAPSEQSSRLHAWARLCDAYALKAEWFVPDVGLFEMIGFAMDGNAGNVYGNIGKGTGWKWAISDVQRLTGPDGLNLRFPDDQKGDPGNWPDEIAFWRIKTAKDLIDQLGVSVEEAIEWRNAPDTDQAGRMLSALRARYDEDTWPEIAKPIRNGLRNRQRAALVSWLIGNAGFADEAALYEHFLIDVEMSACQMTSRIKQGIASVQLFVQRVLLHLEPGVSLSRDEAKQWEWMKHYRMWEANRKVFLYPENWIEPELRDDKSPFFEELENQLLQAEVTDEAAEQVFLNYLHQLDEVARLEICGAYHQVENDKGEQIPFPLDGWMADVESDVTTDVLHVFARTRGTPHIYYYRRRIDSAYWTPWEKVELDIEGDHLIPVMYNRRLYLIWPQFIEKAAEPENLSDGNSESPKRYFELRMQWSRYQNGKWEPKKISAEKVLAGPYAGKYFNDLPNKLEKDDPRWGNWYVGLEKKNFLFWVHPEGSDLIIHVLRKCLEETIDITAENSQQSDTATLTIPKNNFVKEDSFRFQGCDGTMSIEAGDVFDPSDIWFWRQQPKAFQHGNMKMFHDFEMAGLEMTDFNNPHIAVLNKNASQYNLLQLQQYAHFASQDAFFYEDQKRTFFVQPYKLHINAGFGVFDLLIYGFQGFNHPYSSTFIRQLNRYGNNGLLVPEKGETQLKRQQLSDDYFLNEYSPAWVGSNYPKDEIDFSWHGSYSQYNWELFFHAPLLIADRLRANQKFSEALRWLNYIFNPANEEKELGSKHYWNVKPFFEEKGSKPISELMLMLHADDGNGDKADLENQINQWRENPFKPHLIARLRPVAYMKTVVMKYLDVLIEWGDHLFQQDSIESINEATQLYILAGQILGDRPQRVSGRHVAPKSFAEIKGALDEFSNALVIVENALQGTGSVNPVGDSNPPSIVQALYFCIPENEKLLGYWDTVEDRLFKVRHCMNVKGVVRQLPLFQPPIDPALLVRATAAGLDIGEALQDLNAPMPHYRYSVLLQKANEFCADVKGLGSALLSALEKKDAEELALLRSSHEVMMLKAARQVREQQIEETKSALEGLKWTRAITEFRREHYASLEEGDLSDAEKKQANSLKWALGFEIGAQSGHLLAAILAPIPEMDIGVCGIGPTVKARYGGSNLSYAVRDAAAALSTTATIYNHRATMAGINAGHERRMEDWQFQKDIAAKELEQIDEQILGAEIRMAIAERELSNHDLQVESAKEVSEWMKNKYTNKQLYGWMVSQLSTLHRQSYQLAYDLAKRVQRAYQYELGDTSVAFIEFGHWDSQKQGLLAGERLQQQLRQMDAAYLDNNKRELELTRHISLSLIDPNALLHLKQENACEVYLPEALFDMDQPGLYFRRIKSVALSIPCVTGPYASVNCKLTLLSSEMRRTPTAQGPTEQQFGAIQSIVTSSAQNDSGMFEPNLNDARYLPFEGAGAVSRWRLELPEQNQFDYNTISDVMMHLRYTARDGGSTFKDDVSTALKTALDGLANSTNSPAFLFSARHAFPDEWHRFLHPADGQAHELKINLGTDRLPYVFQWAGPQIEKVEFYLHADSVVDLSTSGGEATLLVTNPSDSNSDKDVTFKGTNPIGELQKGDVDISGDAGEWTIAVNQAGGLSANQPPDNVIAPDRLKDILMLVHYKFN